jgi:hypothetical protein
VKESQGTSKGDFSTFEEYPHYRLDRAFDARFPLPL